MVLKVHYHVRVIKLLFPNNKSPNIIVQVEKKSIHKISSDYNSKFAFKTYNLYKQIYTR